MKRFSGGLGTKQIRMLLSVLVLFTCSSLRGFAQTDQGTITGVVTDTSGAVVPNAQMTLTNVDTTLSLTRQTDASGVYTFSPVKIGSYEIRVSAPGFTQVDRQGLHLDIQQRLEVDFSLKPGSTTEQVLVTSAAPLMQTEDASTGQVVDAKTVDATPLNGRNWVFIAQLTAGVDPSNGSRGQSTGDFNANGQRAEQNNYILDGVDNNAAVVDFLGGSSFVVRPPPDALAEFNVQTGSYDAEFGHAAGAVINAAIKSGTNQIHGDLWEYWRNTVLDARDFTATTIPEYNQNQFGGTLGFPIIRNRLFFFADTEANRIVFANPSENVSVPSALERQGNFSELLNPALSGSAQPIQLYQPGSANPAAKLICNGQNNVFCPSQIDPVAQHILNLYPSPNTGNGVLFNNYTFQSKVSSNTFQFDTRLDWDVSAKDQAYSRFSYSNQLQFYPSPLGQLLDGGSYGTDGNVNGKGENFMLSETHDFTNSLINEFRFGYNYGHFSDTQPGADTDTAAAVGLGGIPFTDLNGGLPATTISGISSFGAPQFYAANEYENVFQILDNVTKIRGNHTLKTGVSFQHLRFYTLAPTSPRGAYTFNGLFTSVPGVSFTGYGVADFIANSSETASLSNLSGVDDVQWNDAAYFEDHWKVSERLTLNLGLRYEFWQPYSERHDLQSSLFPTSVLSPGATIGNFVLPQSQRSLQLSANFLSLLATSHVSVVYDSNRQLTTGQSTNFAPRAGFAYKLNDKSVVRGGYGLFYGGTQGLGGTNVGFNYPYQFTSNFPSTSCMINNCPTDGITLESGFTQQIAAGLLNSVSSPSLNGFPPHVKTPYSQQFNLAVEYQLRGNLVATASYVGSNARHLYVIPNTNSPLDLVAPGVNTLNYEPFPVLGGLSDLDPAGISNYNSLQTKLEQRYANGLNFLATYTYAHSLDDAPTALGSTGDPGYRNPNLIGISGDYSNSPWDTRHRVTLNGTYELPVGRGKKYLNQGKLSDILAGGWSTSLVWRAETGQPFTVSNSNSGANGATEHAILVRNPFRGGGSPDPSNPGITCPTKVRTLAHWYNPCAFANPPDGSVIAPGQEISGASALPYLGGPRENAFGPGYNRTDMSIFKAFPVFREQVVQFRADVFNLFNTPAWGPPNGSIGTNGGQISSARTFQLNTPDARFFQLALKYVF
jgi:hypothetical protein